MAKFIKVTKLSKKKESYYVNVDLISKMNENVSVYWVNNEEVKTTSTSLYILGENLPLNVIESIQELKKLMEG